MIKIKDFETESWCRMMTLTSDECMLDGIRADRETSFLHRISPDAKT